MSYKEHSDESCESMHTLSCVAAIAGLVGLAFLGYKKRDSIPWEKLSHLKEKSQYFVDPLWQGAKESSQRVSNSTQQTKEEIEATLNRAFDILHEHVDQFGSDVKDSYQNQLDDLKQKIKELKNSSNTPTI